MPLYYIDASTLEMFQKSKKFEKISRATLILSNTLSQNTDFGIVDEKFIKIITLIKKENAPYSNNQKCYLNTGR